MSQFQPTGFSDSITFKSKIRPWYVFSINISSALFWDTSTSHIHCTARLSFTVTTSPVPFKTGKGERTEAARVLFHNRLMSPQDSGSSGRFLLLESWIEQIYQTFAFSSPGSARNLPLYSFHWFGRGWDGWNYKSVQFKSDSVLVGQFHPLSSMTSSFSHVWLLSYYIWWNFWCGWKMIVNVSVDHTRTYAHAH